MDDFLLGCFPLCYSSGVAECCADLDTAPSVVLTHCGARLYVFLRSYSEMICGGSDLKEHLLALVTNLGRRRLRVDGGGETDDFREEDKVVDYEVYPTAIGVV